MLGVALTLGACARKPASPPAHVATTTASARPAAPPPSASAVPRARTPLPEPKLAGALSIALDDEDSLCVRKDHGGIVCAVPGRDVEPVYAFAVSESEVEFALGPLGMCTRDQSGAVDCLRPSRVTPHASPASVAHLTSFDRQPTTHLLGMFAGYCGARGADVVCEDAEHRSYVLSDDLAIDSISMTRASVCAATSREGILWCFDLGVDGSLHPGEYPEARGVVETASGEYHTCVRFESGKVACFGDDSLAQLGTTKRPRRDALVPVTLPKKAVRLAAGQSHTCALLEDGAVACWGTAERGAATGVDQGGVKLAKCRVVRVDHVARARPVVGGRAGSAQGQSLDLPVYDESVVCAQGDDEIRVQARPAMIMKLPKAKAIAAGRFRTCVLGEAGEVACWGGAPVRFAAAKE